MCLKNYTLDTCYIHMKCIFPEDFTSISQTVWLIAKKKKIEESSSISNRDISIKGWHKMLLLHFQYFKSSRHKVNRTILQLTMYQIWIITEVVVLKFYPKIHIKDLEFLENNQLKTHLPKKRHIFSLDGGVKVDFLLKIDFIFINIHSTNFVLQPDLDLIFTHF